MIRYFILISCFFSMCFPYPVLAVQIPKPSPGDGRVRYVAYDAANVVHINGYFGYQTFILFSEGEVITDLGSGDNDAWSIGVIQAKNGFFIKPKGNKASTNLTVITNRRHYMFDLIHHEQKGGKKEAPPYYMVRFTYPGDEAQKRASKAERERVQQHLDRQATNTPLNYNYWYDGSDALKPIQAWDNGTFTYLRFAPGRDFPSVFMANEEDPEIESTVNLHVEGDTLVIHKIAEMLVLRKGNLALGIWKIGRAHV